MDLNSAPGYSDRENHRLIFDLTRCVRSRLVFISFQHPRWTPRQATLSADREDRQSAQSGTFGTDV